MDFPSLHSFLACGALMTSPGGKGSGNLYPLAALRGVPLPLGGIFEQGGWDDERRGKISRPLSLLCLFWRGLGSPGVTLGEGKAAGVPHGDLFFRRQTLFYFSYFTSSSLFSLPPFSPFFSLSLSSCSNCDQRALGKCRQSQEKKVVVLSVIYRNYTKNAFF